MSTVIGFLDRYIASHDVTPVYAKNFRNRVKKLAAFVGTTSIIEIFTEERVNEFLASFDDATPDTVRSYRASIVALWNYAADLGMAPYPVMRRIRRPKQTKKVIECYSLDEVRAIVAAAEKCYPYPLSTGTTRDLYWPAIIRLAWDSGLRRGDCWQFRQSWIRPDGTAPVVQNKTGQRLLVRLHPSTIAALAKIPFDKATEWPSGLSNSGRFSKQFRDIARKAGVAKGLFKWLRRSSGSYCELAQPGSGGKHLGHASPQVFGAHYDARLAGHTGPMPPDLASDAPKDSGFDVDGFAFM